MAESKEESTQEKIDQQDLLKWWVAKEGTKLGNLMYYLKQLWTNTPAAKVIIFSQVRLSIIYADTNVTGQFTSLLKKISALLSEKNIENLFLERYFAIFELAYLHL